MVGVGRCRPRCNVTESLSLRAGRTSQRRPPKTDLVPQVSREVSELCGGQLHSTQAHRMVSCVTLTSDYLHVSCQVVTTPKSHSLTHRTCSGVAWKQSKSTSTRTRADRMPLHCLARYAHRRSVETIGEWYIDADVRDLSGSAAAVRRANAVGSNLWQRRLQGAVRQDGGIFALIMVHFSGTPLMLPFEPPPPSGRAQHTRMVSTDYRETYLKNSGQLPAKEAIAASTTYQRSEIEWACSGPASPQP